MYFINGRHINVVMAVRICFCMRRLSIFSLLRRRYRKEWEAIALLRCLRNLTYLGKKTHCMIVWSSREAKYFRIGKEDAAWSLQKLKHSINNWLGSLFFTGMDWWTRSWYKYWYSEQFTLFLLSVQLLHFVPEKRLSALFSFPFQSDNTVTLTDSLNLTIFLHSSRGAVTFAFRLLYESANDVSLSWQSPFLVSWCTSDSCILSNAPLPLWVH